VLDFYISASCCNILLSGFSFDAISAAKSTLKNVFFATDLYVYVGTLITDSFFEEFVEIFYFASY